MYDCSSIMKQLINTIVEKYIDFDKLFYNCNKIEISQNLPNSINYVSAKRIDLIEKPLNGKDYLSTNSFILSTKKKFIKINPKQTNYIKINNKFNIEYVEFTRKQKYLFYLEINNETYNEIKMCGLIDDLNNNFLFVGNFYHSHPFYATPNIWYADTNGNQLKFTFNINENIDWMDIFYTMENHFNECVNYYSYKF